MAIVGVGNELVLTFRLQKLPGGAPPGETLPEAQYCNLKVTVVGWVEFGSDVYKLTKWVTIKRPVGGVKVVAEGPTPNETLTELDGTATFYRLLTGAYTVKVVHDGSVVAQQGVSLAKDTEVTVEVPSTVVLGRIKEGPTYFDAGGRFLFEFAHVPVPGTVYSAPKIGLLVVRGDLLDDSSVEVFESDDPAMRDIGDPRVVFRYTVHNMRVRFESYLAAWRSIVECSAGDYSPSFWYQGLDAAWAGADSHAREAVSREGTAAFVGEYYVPDWTASPLYVRVRGAGKYLHVKVWDRDKARYTLATLPVAKA
jgi:hypothetical protein